MTRRKYLPILMTTTAALLWATSFTVVKIGLRYVDSYTFVLLRFLAATAILLCAHKLERGADRTVKRGLLEGTNDLAEVDRAHCGSRRGLPYNRAIRG